MATLESLSQMDGGCPYHRVVFSSAAPEELRNSVRTRIGELQAACEIVQLPPSGWKGVIRNVPIADRIVDAPPIYAVTVRRNKRPMVRETLGAYH
jgi:hypothetical protein